MRPALKKLSSPKGQTTLEAALALLLVVPAVTLFLLAAFHITGWVWTEYWAYQGLHCVYEKGARVDTCKRALENQFTFHPGPSSVNLHHLRRSGAQAEVHFTYKFNLGVKSWKVDKKWALSKP
jgi:hypothetical protein